MKKVLVFICVLLVLVAVGSFAQKHQIKNNTITIAWIPKALNNPVFEIGRVGALKKAEELTAKGPYKVEIFYVASVASDMAEQAQRDRGRHRQGRRRHRHFLQRPDGLRGSDQEGHRGGDPGHDLGLGLPEERAVHLPGRGQLRGRQGRGRPARARPWGPRARSPC